jgi:4-amino-4-deoxy-L-arabinose transferase-like glycosyltransferase
MRTPRHLLRSRELTILLLITAGALLIRLIFSFVVFPRLAGPLGLGTDPDEFALLAQNWLSGQGFKFSEAAGPAIYRGPGYPLLLVGVLLVFDQLFPSVVVVHSLVGALVCPVVFGIGKRAFGSAAGLTAAALAAIHPLLIWYTPRLRYEILLTLLLALAIYWAIRATQTGARPDWLAAGLFFGLTALVNQIALPLGLLVLGGLALTGYRRQFLRNSAISGKLGALSALIAMSAIILPWTVRNYQVSGQIVPVHSGLIMQFVKGNYEFAHYQEAPLRSVQLDAMSAAYVVDLLDLAPGQDVRTLGVDQQLAPYALAAIRQEPGAIVVKTVAQIPRFWYLSETPTKSWALALVQACFLLPALVGAGYAWQRRRRDPPLLIALLTPIIYFNLVYAATHVEGRYATPIIPFVVVLAAAGLLALVAAGARRWPARLQSSVEPDA